MLYQTVLFDIDGTLCDPGTSITESVQYALSRLGIEEPNLNALRRFVGPPLEHSFQEYYGLDDTQTKQAVAYYRDKFQAEGIKLYTAYNGIPELLQELSNLGKYLGVVTAKPDTYAGTVLETTGIRQYFDVIGARPFDEVVKKEVTLAKVLAGLTPQQVSSVVMIGDRMHDIEAASALHINSIGVLYGYGSEQELKGSGATHIVKNVDALRQLLIS